MSQESTLKVGSSKRKKHPDGVGVKATIKISGTLHKYFSSDKIITPVTLDDNKLNNIDNEDNKDTNKSKSLVSKEQINNVTLPSSGKLWPCFVRAKPMKENILKKTEDEAKSKAKAIFLESGAPEVLLKKKIKFEDDLALDKPVPFPLINHVTQILANSYVKELNLPLPHTRCSLSPPLSPSWRAFSVNQLSEPEIEVFERTVNAKSILSQLNEQNPKTDVKALYKTLKKYKKETQSNLWTEIYKPLTSLDFLGNSEQIGKFKTWLDDLKKKKNREAAESSSDEFVDGGSDDEANNFSQNVAVIKGPCGSGKTSAVFAVANELDCKVLEINTSCNRSGKRILAEFLESTQSHQVKRVNVTEELSTNNLVKSRKRKRSKTAEDRKMEKTSLILVEEADLVFEDIDEGFTQAIFSLASSSKRPLILITNHSRNPHLERFKNSDLLELSVTRPRCDKLELWLRIVGLVEGIVVTHAQATRLIQWARADVRRCLLQLQIMLMTNNSEVQESVTAAGLWWNWPLAIGLKYQLPTFLKSENDSDAAVIETPSKEELLKRLYSVVTTTSRLVCLDILTSHSTLGGEGPCSVSWMAQPEDSVMLTEHRKNRSDGNCPQELAEWLLYSASSNTRSGHPRSLNSQEAKWLSVLRQGEQLYLSGVSVSQLTSRDSLTCDYLPALRTLGRSDQVRLPVFTRRTSRIFSYLQGLGIHATKSYNDFMCDSFS